MSKSLDLPDVVWRRLRSETDHDLRAAIICLLTAALADKGMAAVIGESEGGWFWLPPWSLWEPWAKEGLETASKKMASEVISVPEQPFMVGSINLNRDIRKCSARSGFRLGFKKLTQF